MKLLEGKKALVTGGSRGIGRAIALRLASEGADVAITYMSRDKEAADTAIEIEKLGASTMFFKADSTDCGKAGEVVTSVCSVFGGIDILVNNAGIRSDNLLLRMDEDQWDRVLEANLKSAYNYTKAVLPSMLSARGGSIINISSVVGLDGNAGQSNYAASKAGLIGLTRSLAKELGPKGIRVNCIAPGFILSEMTVNIPGDIHESWVKDISLRRAGTPDEVAGVALFLAASSLSSYVTGEVINCSGNIKG